MNPVQSFKTSDDKPALPMDLMEYDLGKGGKFFISDFIHAP